MIIIPKDSAIIYLTRNKVFYCFNLQEECKEKYKDIINKAKFLPHRITEDVTVNDNYQLHSFNGNPAFFYRYGLNNIKAWFINGINKRENPERAIRITKKKFWVLNNESFNIEDVLINIKKLKKINDHNS
jgi:hypothetical protein